MSLTLEERKPDGRAKAKAVRKQIAKATGTFLEKAPSREAPLVQLTEKATQAEPVPPVTASTATTELNLGIPQGLIHTRREVKVKLPTPLVLRLYYLKLTTNLTYSDLVEDALTLYFSDERSPK